MLIKKIIFFFLIIFQTAQAEEKVVTMATVNDITITNIDLMNEIKVISILYNNINNNNENIKIIALNNIIEEILKKKEIIKNKIVIEKKIIDSHYFNISKNLNNIPKIILDKIYEKIKINYEWNKLISTMYSNKIYINIKEIDKKFTNKTIKKENLINEKEKFINEEKIKKLGVFSNNHLEILKRNATIKIF